VPQPPVARIDRQRQRDAGQRFVCRFGSRSSFQRQRAPARSQQAQFGARLQVKAQRLNLVARGMAIERKAQLMR